MNKNSKLSREVLSTAIHIEKQFQILKAAPENGHFRAKLDTFFSMVSSFDESLGWIWQERFRSELRFDYCPAVAEASLEEVEHRYRRLADHIENLGATTRISLKAWLRNACRLSAELVGAVDWLVSEVASDIETASNDRGAMPNLSHRISPIGHESGTLGLVDTVSMSINKAVAVVTMLSNSFAIDDDENRPSDNSIYYALQSIQHELLDVGAVVEAFHRNTTR